MEKMSLTDVTALDNGAWTPSPGDWRTSAEGSGVPVRPSRPGTQGKAGTPEPSPS